MLERVPELISGAILNVTGSLYGVMFLIVLFLVFCGFFIDATVLIIMFTPYSCL